MAAFINAEQAKIMSNQAYLDIEIYKLRLCTRQISQNPYPIRILPS